MESNVEAPTPPQHLSSLSSFSSLPEDIVLNCLARVPMTSYYRKLFFVSKSFRSLIFSKDLANARHRLRTTEKCVFLCLKLPNRYRPYWFNLFINDTGNLLVPMPSSYTPYLPVFPMTIGSEFYLFDGRTAPSSVFSVSKTLDNRKWPKTPSMKVARMNTLVMNYINDKIYVMGGCEPYESTHWGEVFDIKTQTWEALPDPGHELRFSSLKRLVCNEGKLYVITNKKTYVYDPKQGSWHVTGTAPRYWVGSLALSDSMCIIDNVTYRFCNQTCHWYDSTFQAWKRVKGLDMLDTYDNKYCVEMANYGGKLIMFWDIPNGAILCAVISLERREYEVWGQIGSVDVLKIPDSSILISCAVGCI